MKAFDDIVNKPEKERTRLEKCIINASTSDWSDDQSLIAINAAEDLSKITSDRQEALEMLNTMIVLVKILSGSVSLSSTEIDEVKKAAKFYGDCKKLSG